MNIDLTKQECDDILFALNSAPPGVLKRDIRIGRLVNRLMLAMAQPRVDTARTAEEVAKLSPLAMLQRLTDVLMRYHAHEPCPYCQGDVGMPCTPDCFATVTINGILAARENA